jgi:hypothetical protein
MTTWAVPADKIGADRIWCLDSGACLLDLPRAIWVASAKIQDHTARRTKQALLLYRTLQWAVSCPKNAAYFGP